MNKEFTKEDLGFVWRLLLVLVITVMTYMIIFKILMYFVPLAFILLLLCVGMYMLFYTIYGFVDKYIDKAISACKQSYNWVKEKTNVWFKTNKTPEASNQEAASTAV